MIHVVLKKQIYVEFLMRLFWDLSCLFFFISDLEKQMQNILFKFVDDTKSGGAASTLQGRAPFRAMDLESVEERSNRKPYENAKFCTLGWMNPVQLRRQNLPGWVAALLRRCRGPDGQ